MWPANRVVVNLQGAPRESGVFDDVGNDLVDLFDKVVVFVGVAVNGRLFAVVGCANTRTVSTNVTSSTGRPNFALKLV